MKNVKTEHILIGVGAGVALYFGYNHMQKMQEDKRRLQALEQQKQNLMMMQQNGQTQQTTTGTGSKVESTVQDAKSILDLFASSGLLTNNAKQDCISKGGKWDSNGLFKKGVCVEGAEQEQITRGTEVNHREIAYFDKSQLKEIAGLNIKGELI
ncbi:hypothetical protein ACE193_15310 [Bernardetia sp. OM2101]|uniref:hypothetical protein n=1 Tax=Bernardetia sp. OM2101 TaxID=3344876 RepID=UPI0035D0DCE7